MSHGGEASGGDQQPAAAPVQRVAAGAGPCATFNIQPPESFDFSKPQEWDKWIRRFERFRLASNLHASSEENQVNTLIYCMGDEADDILRGLTLTDVERSTYKEDVAAHCEIKCMPTFHFYRNGKKVDEFSGGNREKLEEMVAKHK